MVYEGILGGFRLQPSLIWTRDVKGTGTGPAVAFIEKRKSITAVVSLEYNNRWTASLSYTTFFDGTPTNLLADRDFMRLNLIFYY